MAKHFVRDSFGWGFVLWLIGFALGILLFPFVPAASIGWVIAPIGIVITLWVLWKKVQGDSLRYYALLAVVWVLIAVVCDYFFLVKVFKPADGYYKPDVYLYYALNIRPAADRRLAQAGHAETVRGMKYVWFEKWGWIHRPASAVGWLLSSLALASILCLFVVVDSHSHSVSDTLIGVFPWAWIALATLNWIASKTSGA